MDNGQRAKRLAEIFKGLRCAYGTYTISSTSVNGKRKGQASVIKEPRGVEVWLGHVTGDGVSVGIVPINEEDSCVWGCIDVDTYPLDHKKLVENINGLKLPLVVCRSKSGGAHCFLFTKDWVPAQLMQETLKALSAELGYSGSEIFPKQIALNIERGDYGNFLNMPYYDAEEGMRYAIKEDGTSATLDEFFDMHEGSAQTLEQVQALGQREQESSIIVTDGPPCLQTLCAMKIGEGGRNSGLFNIGVYLRKANPETWEVDMVEYNSQFLDPPLPRPEVETIIKQLGRDKEKYFYTCNDAPINGYCNKPVCLTRKHGVGGGSNGPTLANLRKITSDPPVWFLDVNGVPVELTSEELQNQTLFQRQCMVQVNVFPPTLKKVTWERAVTGLLTAMVEIGAIIEASKDAGIKGQFYDLLEEFCTAMQQAESWEELLLKRPYTDLSEGRTYFAIKDFEAYLTKNKFNEYSRSLVCQRLRDIGGENPSKRIKGKKMRVWSIPAYERHGEEGVTTKTIQAESGPF